MQVVLEVLLWLVVEVALWAPGAVIKKLLGRPLSASGLSEQLIGLAVVLLGVFLVIWWAHSV
jgi:hypothetical protein